MNDDTCLAAGAAKAPIRIPEDFFPYRGIRGRLYTGQRDDIHARCIMIGGGEASALILSLELGDFGDIDLWLERISAASGVPVCNIMITVTHNHEAPHLSDSYNQPVTDVEKTALFGEYVRKAVLEAVAGAKAAMRPARLGYGTGECDINVNRDQKIGERYEIGADPHGPVDRTVAVLRLDDLQGLPIAYLVNYAVHACVMFDAAIKDGGMLVTGDLAGATSRLVEERTGAVALWTSGAAADLNPRYLAKRLRPDGKGGIERVDGGEAGYLLMQVQAEALADEVLVVSAGMGKAAPLALAKGIQRSYSVPGQKKAQNPFALPAGYEYQDGEPVLMRLSLLLLNNVALVGIPGELVCSIGKKLKESLPYRNVVAVTHCNGSISYMSDESGFERRTFEALVSHVRRGCAEGAVLSGAAELLDELLAK